mgnify:CR=1 FL=1
MTDAGAAAASQLAAEVSQTDALQAEVPAAGLKRTDESIPQVGTAAWRTQQVQAYCAAHPRACLAHFRVKPGVDSMFPSFTSRLETALKPTFLCHACDNKEMRGSAAVARVHVERMHAEELRAIARKRARSAASSSSSSSSSSAPPTAAAAAMAPPSSVYQLLQSMARGGEVRQLPQKVLEHLYRDMAIACAVSTVPPNVFAKPFLPTCLNSAFRACHAGPPPPIPVPTTIYRHVYEAGHDVRRLIVGEMRALLDRGATYCLSSDVVSAYNMSFNGVVVSAIDPSTFALYHNVIDIVPLEDASHTAEVVGNSLIDICRQFDPKLGRAYTSTTDGASAALAASRVFLNQTRAAGEAVVCLMHVLGCGLKQVMKVPRIKDAIKDVTGSVQSIIQSPKRATLYTKYSNVERAPREMDVDDNDESERTSSAVVLVQMVPELAPMGSPDDVFIERHEALMSAVDELEERDGGDDDEDDPGAPSDKTAREVEESDDGGDDGGDAAVRRAVEKEVGHKPKVPPIVRFHHLTQMLTSAVANAETINRVISEVPALRQTGTDDDGLAKRSKKVKMIKEEDQTLGRRLLKVLLPISRAIKHLEGFVSAGTALYHLRGVLRKLVALNLDSDVAEARDRVVAYLESTGWGRTARRRGRGVVATRDKPFDAALLSAIVDPRLAYSSITLSEEECEHAYDLLRREMLANAAADATIDVEMVGAKAEVEMLSDPQIRRWKAAVELREEEKACGEEVDERLVSSIKLQIEARSHSLRKAANVSASERDVDEELRKYRVAVAAPALCAMLDPKTSPLSESLDWWRSNKSEFPQLAPIAAKFLAVPGSTASVESAWSIFSAIVTARRASMNPDSAAAFSLLCLRGDLAMKGLHWKMG